MNLTCNDRVSDQAGNRPRVLADGLTLLVARRKTPIEQAVLLMRSTQEEFDGYDAIIVLVGPQRWHPSKRTPFVASLRALGARVGLTVDVYPVRPTDTTRGPIGDEGIRIWLRNGISLLKPADL
ncbi:MAG: hypothetical protein H7288_22055 [Kineosporiaceae bacterium]|nr:hypothetical protein [Aeromicrobium sp.]